MKKLLLTLILSSLTAPSLLFALPSTYMASEEYSQQERKVTNQANKIKKEATQETSHMSLPSTHPRVASSTKEIGFCSQIDKILIRIGTQELTSKEKKDTSIRNHEEKEKTPTVLDIRRIENETKRKIQFEELSRRATTTEQKQALATFKVTLEKAVLDRKKSIDSLILLHRNEIDERRAIRDDITKKNVDILTTTINAAKKQALKDCTHGKPGSEVRANLKEAILQAQKTFKDTTQLQKKDLPILQITTKKKEMEIIETTFKKTIEEAKSNLQASFKVSVTSTSTLQ